jgi:hypothetical protein
MTKGDRTRKGHIKGLLKVSGSCTFEYRRTVWLAYARQRRRDAEAARSAAHFHLVTVRDNLLGSQR